MKKALRSLIALCSLGAVMVILGYYYLVVSVSALVLHLLLLTGTIILSCFGLQLCERVEFLEGLIYRLALKVGRRERREAQ